MEHTYQGRIQALRESLQEKGASSLLVTHRPNILYLCGFTGDSAALLVDLRRTTLFTDGRFRIQAAQETGKICHVEVHSTPLPDPIGSWLKKSKVKKVGFDPARVTVAQMKALRGAGGRGVRWTPLGGLVEGLRAIKSPEEIVRIRRAARLGCEVLGEVLPLVKPGVRELELAAEIEHRMRQKGSQGPAFETIVASGARAALPHARPSARRLRKNELVVLDLGAILADYCCDLTRTVYLGRAPRRVRVWYQAVLEAQAAARDALKTGTHAGAIDAAARAVLAAARLDGYFVHSTGHGLGLEVHEEPRLARGGRQVIRAGMVVTIEPGVYVEGIGGIRIEDDVAVHEGGTEVLTNAPREFMEL